RDGAVAHAENCVRCAMRLRDERTLTAGLGRLSASTATKEAPARIESALRAAFREQHESRLAPTVINQSHGRRWTRWAFATAAMILILLSVAALRPGHLQGPVENAIDLTGEPAAPALAPREALPPPAATSGERGQNVSNVIKRKSSRTPRLVAGNTKDRAVRKPQAVGQEATEIATDFIPLLHGDELNLMESGQMVRVELPRSALISFGLPMNMERADERIKADVVLGSDGLARAIRFVK
ncbi:MAG TPA: hypothetical protein VJZ26_18090, partial [Blastocatellia bacterium]|nr:hypothetical protein [Blastocatellia bacterium]